MRHESPQLPLVAPWIAHAHATDLAAMSAVLDEQPAFSALVQQDLERVARGMPGPAGLVSRARRRCDCCSCAN